MMPCFKLSSLRRLFRLRNLLFACLMLACFIWAFYAEENWRGGRAWARYVRDATAQGLHVEWASVIPPPVPYADNFAMTPVLADLYIYKRGMQANRDPSVSGKIALLVNGLLDSKLDFSVGDWMRGERASLSGCLTNYFEYHAPKPMSAEVAKRFGFTADQIQQMSRTFVESEITNRTFHNSKATDIIGLYSKMSSTAQAHDILQLLELMQPIWNELHEAMERPFCRYPVKYDQEKVYGISIPHLRIIKDLCKFLRLAAICHLELGDSKSAFADLELGFYLSNTLKTDPWLVAYFVRGSCDHLLTQGIWEGTSRHLWSSIQLERLQKLRTPSNEIAEVRRKLLNERTMNIISIDEQLKSFRFDWAAMRRDGFSRVQVEYSLYFLCGPRGWFDWEKYNLSRRYDEFVPRVFVLPSGRIATNEFSRMRAWWDGPARQNPFQHHSFFTGMMSPQLEYYSKKVAKEQTTIDLAYLGCALERYRLDKGRWPGRLPDLSPQYAEKLPFDIMTGEPYRYRLIDNNHFILYSVGIDGRDDGGTAHFDPEHKKTDDEGDWLWTGGVPES